MNENTTPAPARKRAPGLRWKRFWQLERSDSFYIGQTLCIKSGMFRASNGKKGSFTINPFRKVRSMEPVAKPAPSEGVQS